MREATALKIYLERDTVLFKDRVGIHVFCISEAELLLSIYVNHFLLSV